MFIKFLKSTVVIFGTIIIAVIATRAAWDDVAASSNNVFQTGILDISVIPDAEIFDTSLYPIYPGWTQTAPLSVINRGTVPLNYDIAAVKSSGDNELFASDKLLLKIGTTEGGSEIYGGPSGLPLSSLSTAKRVLPTNTPEQLFFTATLSQDAGNELQDKNATINFVFNAK